MWQEAHPGNDLVWPDHADLVVWLLTELDVVRRLVRVDAALAGQLGRSIKRNSRVRAEIEQWAKAYPLDRFPRTRPRQGRGTVDRPRHDAGCDQRQQHAPRRQPVIKIMEDSD